MVETWIIGTARDHPSPCGASIAASILHQTIMPAITTSNGLANCLFRIVSRMTSSPWINPACLDLCIRSSTHLIDDLHERPVMMKAIRAVARRYGNTYPSLHLARAAVQILSGRMPRSIHGLDTALMHPVLSERADQWASQFRDPIHLASWVTLIDRHRPMRSM
jgi:hypothetical protein